MAKRGRPRTRRIAAKSGQKETSELQEDYHLKVKYWDRNKKKSRNQRLFWTCGGTDGHNRRTCTKKSIAFMLQKLDSRCITDYLQLPTVVSIVPDAKMLQIN